jgi:hypothetical protein
MISIATQGNQISVSILGEFTLTDYQAFEQAVLHNLAFEGGVYLLVDMRDMVSYTVDVAWEDIKFASQHRYDFRKIALVTGSEWQTWLAWVYRLFMDADIRVFDEPGIALEWLQQPAEV